MILQGEPGSGESVALRNVGEQMARRARERPRVDSIIPLYLNLKEFRPARPVDDDQVRAFVLHQLNRANSRDVARFLEDEFVRGLRVDPGAMDDVDSVLAELTLLPIDAAVVRAAGVLNHAHLSCGCSGQRVRGGRTGSGFLRE